MNPNLTTYTGPISRGASFRYVERNSVFQVQSLPGANTRYFTVYYPATGEYRRYSEDRIRQCAVPWTGTPKRRPAPKPPVVVTLPGFPNPVEINVETGAITCGCHKSAPGALAVLKRALKGIK